MFACTCILLLLVFSAVWAQAHPGEIKGRVEDDSGQSLPEAIVVLAKVGGDLRRKTTSNAEGFYQFSQLPSGSYRLEVSATGHLVQAREEIQLGEGAAIEVNFRLQSAGDDHSPSRTKRGESTQSQYLHPENR